MTLSCEVAIIDVTARGVQVSLSEDAQPFWLPRSAPGVEWTPPPEIGGVSWVRVPDWLAAKHRPLQELRYQRSFAFQQPLAGLRPEASREGSFPMTDYPQDAGKGMLGRNSKAEKPSHPTHTGVCDIDGKRYRIAAWVKTSDKTGEKYFSLSFRPDERRQQPAQQQPSAGQPNAGREEIPF